MAKAKEEQRDLILLMGSENTKTIFGACRVLSQVNFEDKFPLWWHKTHAPGFCRVDWLYIKILNLLVEIDIER